MAVRAPTRPEVGQHPPDRRSNYDLGAPMSERVPEPWYGFIDGPRKSNGERDPFDSRKAASVWMLITLAITAGVTGAIAAGIIILRAHIAAIGFLVPLVLAGAPVAIASLIAFIHTAEDLIGLIRSDRVHHENC